MEDFSYRTVTKGKSDIHVHVLCVYMYEKNARPSYYWQYSNCNKYFTNLINWDEKMQ